MNFHDSADEAAFRAELRAWLADNAPKSPVPRDEDARLEFLEHWHRDLHGGGWVGLSLPVAYGGRGLGPVHEAILNEELSLHGAPPAPAMIGYLVRTLLLAGSEEQKREILPGLISGEIKWCQGYSEPGAGSDLAALATRAERRGDDYVINGQKVWTSNAQRADFCLVLARSEPDAPRHRGISAFAVPMKAHGVSVRPILQITGDREFSEVFFDDAVVPATAMIGEPGAGWPVALATLAYERGPVDVGFTVRYRNALTALEQSVRDGECSLDAAGRARLARAYVDIEVLRIHVLRSLSARAAGLTPGPEGSVDKLLMTAADQRLYHTALDMLGAAPLIEQSAEWTHDYLYSRAASTYGGTSQIQRNILATRLLGLPSAS